MDGILKVATVCLARVVHFRVSAIFEVLILIYLPLLLRCDVEQLLEILFDVVDLLAQSCILLQYLRWRDSAKTFARGPIAEIVVGTGIVIELKRVPPTLVGRAEFLGLLLVQGDAGVSPQFHLLSDDLRLGGAIMLAPPVTEEIALQLSDLVPELLVRVQRSGARRFDF